MCLHYQEYRKKPYVARWTEGGKTRNRFFASESERAKFTEPDGFELAIHKDSEIDYDWEREGDEVLYVIQDVADIDGAVANDVLEILREKHGDRHSWERGEECEFDPDATIAPKIV